MAPLKALCWALIFILRMSLALSYSLTRETKKYDETWKLSYNVLRRK